ncbi:proline-rich receptor-like protein kinase PERK14 [Schistocerca piceifrons]|uniref:proline-rich receptor-like protein kinase PERK14 n=1 Tax=Schistocerca piceifrons TaxID=274613 RepID=UPI001F5E8C0C|nr:proline-rich receptor-like protein kinase PERK14 [Schistocerca piceifrons]
MIFLLVAVHTADGRALQYFDKPRPHVGNCPPGAPPPPWHSLSARPPPTSHLLPSTSPPLLLMSSQLSPPMLVPPSAVGSQGRSPTPVLSQQMPLPLPPPSQPALPAQSPMQRPPLPWLDSDVKMEDTTVSPVPPHAQGSDAAPVHTRATSDPTHR